MNRMTILILGVLSVSLLACQPDPRKEAEAYATRIKAEQDALNQAMNREHSDEIHNLEVQQLQVEQGHREATKQEWRNGLNNMIRIGFWFATAVLCYFMFMAGRSVTNAISAAGTGIATAIVRAADVRANLIRLDPVTRQYPIFLQYADHGRIAAFNPNVNSLTLLDTRSEPDRQMIAAMGAVQYVGVLAREAGKSVDPAGVSVIKAPVIEVTSEMVTLAKELMRKESDE